MCKQYVKLCGYISIEYLKLSWILLYIHISYFLEIFFKKNIVLTYWMQCIWHSMIDRYTSWLYILLICENALPVIDFHRSRAVNIPIVDCPKGFPQATWYILIYYFYNLIWEKDIHTWIFLEINNISQIYEEAILIVGWDILFYHIVPSLVVHWRCWNHPWFNTTWHSI